jgi:hypothetical protein
VAAATLTPGALQPKIAELDQQIKASQAPENDQTARQLGVDLAPIAAWMVLYLYKPATQSPFE